MDPSEPAILRLWRTETIRSNILTHLDKTTSCALRLTQTECSHLVTPALFARVKVTFTPSSFRQCRLDALHHIGHLVQHLSFTMPHTPSTFLPPLINPYTGREVSFLYSPDTSPTSNTSRPKYGCPELGDLLTEQYPPVFHAATNVSSFMLAVSRMPNLRHLTVSTPGQDPAQRYRRSAVDYALISLRMAMERTHLPYLEKLTMNHVHPAGYLYFRPTSSFGCTPAAGRKWRRIRKLYMVMDSWDVYGPRPCLDHLKILDDFIRSFSPQLEKLSFGWNGQKGPCPFTLFDDPLFAPPRQGGKLFAEITSPMSPLPAQPKRKTMHFPRLRFLQVRNAVMDVQQVKGIVHAHRSTVREFDFENVVLRDEGDWEEALAPLMGKEGNGDEWCSERSGSETGSFREKCSFESLSQGGRLEVIEEVIDTAGEATGGMLSGTKMRKKHHHRRRRRRKHRREALAEGIDDLGISVPLDVRMPDGGVLQPVVLDPHVSGVQRNAAQDAAQQALVDDADLRVSVLRKAKEAVLRQLSREYCRSRDQTRAEEQRAAVYALRCSPRIRSTSRLAQESSSALVPLMFTHC